MPIWDRHAIRAEIHRRGSTLTNIALDNGLGASSCRVALLTPSPAANRAISDFLGVPLHELWPDWFDASGQRRGQYRTPAASASPSKDKAA